MKKVTTFNFAVGTLALVAFLGATLLVQPAAAQTTSGAGTVPAAVPMVLEIDDSGNVLLRGTAQSTGDNSIQIESWGGTTWTVNTTPNSTVIPLGLNGADDLSGIRSGDFIGIEGTIDPNNDMTIYATLVRDWTLAPGTVSETFSAQPQTALYIGTVSSTGGAPLAITDTEGNTYQVQASEDVILWNEARANIDFSDIHPGDSLRIEGTLTGDTIVATIIRDISR